MRSDLYTESLARRCQYVLWIARSGVTCRPNPETLSNTRGPSGDVFNLRPWRDQIRGPRTTYTISVLVASDIVIGDGSPLIVRDSPLLSGLLFPAIEPSRHPLGPRGFSRPIRVGTPGPITTAIFLDVSWSPELVFCVSHYASLFFSLLTKPPDGLISLLPVPFFFSNFA